VVDEHAHHGRHCADGVDQPDELLQTWRWVKQ
jgi:hypothetical protein